ncbi:MAG: ABC transporter ATP-binding protein [Fervidicoccaceae archaeon]|nr:MAG: ABC transporter ATP-binding protein [Fervidicoccus sp.]
MEKLLELVGVTSKYGKEIVLERVNLSLEEGKAVVVRGRSGVGKTTLLKIAALLKRPLGGEVIYRGVDVWKENPKKRDELRREISYIPQFPDLIDDLSIRENIVLPLIVRKWKEDEADERARELMESLGIASLAERKPKELSGGQKQRALIARALISNPKVIIADEPTSFLDEDNSDRVFEVLESYMTKNHAGIIISTTELEGSGKAGWEEYHLEKGKLEKKWKEA